MGERSHTGKADETCALTSLSQNLHKVERAELAVCMRETINIIQRSEYGLSTFFNPNLTVKWIKWLLMALYVSLDWIIS